ncbi:alpha/beta fold hydrolase [Nocardia nepalensis]|uniref:alpha/beta fold hydrolase n=1 Tax=Nocardia nepalensis TaxID=3375448 RepID=UPI003B6705FE
MPEQIIVNDVSIDLYPGTKELPPIFLVPGMLGGGWIWEPVAVELSRAGYRVALPSAPLGVHPRVADPDELTTAFGDVMADIFTESTVVAGNSLGSLVALKLAYQRPEAVRALVLSGSPGLGENTRPRVVSSMRSLTKSLAHQQAAQLFYDKSLVTEELIDRFFEVVKENRHKLGVVRALRNTRDYDARDMFSLITCPTLLAWGAEDEISPPQAWAEAAASFPKARFVAIPRSGHSPMIEQPALLTTELLSFLDSALDRPAGGAAEIDVEVAVRTLIADYTHQPFEEVAGDKALDDLGLDSLGTVELILACEDELGITALGDEDLEINTVDDAVAFVRARLDGVPWTGPAAHDDRLVDHR